MPSAQQQYQDRMGRSSVANPYGSSPTGGPAPYAAMPTGAIEEEEPIPYGGNKRSADARAYAAETEGFGGMYRGGQMLQILAELERRGAPIADAVRNIQPGVSQQDIDLVGQSARGAGDIARRELQASLPGILAQITGGDFARGLGGSSIMAANRSNVGSEAVRQLANTLSREQQFAGQQILGQANQRASFEMGRNRQLFEQLIGTVMPQLQTEQFISNTLEGRRTQEENKPSVWDKIGSLAGQAIGSGIGFMAGGPAGVVS